MTNPDYVEPEEESTTSDHTESPDLGRVPKRRYDFLAYGGGESGIGGRTGMAARLWGSIWSFISGLYARLQLSGKRISKELRPIRIWTGFQKTIS